MKKVIKAISNEILFKLGNLKSFRLLNITLTFAPNTHIFNPNW